MFITFEGIEGSGKSTQINLLAQALKKKGCRVVCTREPGGTAVGDQVRSILLNAKSKNMFPLCELLLYYASRAQHIHQVIGPAIKKGCVVLCDRFDDATVAYQGYARGLSLKVLKSLKKIVLKDTQPQLTLLFDLSVKTGLGRAKQRAQKLSKNKREDRFEQEALKFHQRVRAGYLALAKKEPKRFVVLNANQDPQVLHEEILSVVRNAFPSFAKASTFVLRTSVDRPAGRRGSRFGVVQLLRPRRETRDARR